MRLYCKKGDLKNHCNASLLQKMESKKSLQCIFTAKKESKKSLQCVSTAIKKIDHF